MHYKYKEFIKHTQTVLKTCKIKKRYKNYKQIQNALNYSTCI